MDVCSHLDDIYPCRVPLKIIGRVGKLVPEEIARLILQRLGPQPQADQVFSSRPHGPYISYTFWVTLPNEHAERPLREAIQQLPGYVMQI